MACVAADCSSVICLSLVWLLSHQSPCLSSALAFRGQGVCVVFHMEVASSSSHSDVYTACCRPV